MVKVSRKTVDEFIVFVTVAFMVGVITGLLMNGILWVGV